ncbi:MAG TPA: hypothetical protein VFM98_21515 [Ramlibacter sp.]|uniref:hypothetical protein n=1 Tax=Ramlibacter sp. TaxID=1917967 RepID=UPI002D80635A|nr:hypothetical protein [Ramlibacter sp.]HET8748191.1 hypothetical protein [Ramlibacter sp.]
MKLFAALAVVAALGAAAAAPPPPAPVPSPVPVQDEAPAAEPGLREAVQNFLRLEPSAPPWHLSPEERAELRRQLNDYGHPPAEPPVPPENR